jgi:hypothetical protein
MRGEAIRRRCLTLPSVTMAKLVLPGPQRASLLSLGEPNLMRS